MTGGPHSIGGATEKYSNICRLYAILFYNREESQKYIRQSRGYLEREKIVLFLPP